MPDWFKSSYSWNNGTCVSVKLCKGEAVSSDYTKSSFSGPAGHCAAVRMTNDSVLVKDDKHPEIEPLVFTFDEWDAFIKGVKNNEFDLPA